MNKRVLTILFVMMLGLGLPTAVSRSILQAQSQPTAVTEDHIPEGIPIRTSWHPQDDGIVSYYHQAVFGPDICTNYGDPFSPWNSPWTSVSPYTYEYRIKIPADYPYSEVRVELFDPDSINAPNQASYTFGRTDAAILQGLSNTVTIDSCPLGNNQKNTCFIESGELDLYEDGFLSLDRINPYFIWRVDENRGTGMPGNGCGEPGVYDATRNTQTLFELSYFRQNNDGTMDEVSLATYRGQTGTEAVNHLTDRHWVSPGAPPSFDQAAVVPTDSGSFLVDLTDDTPDIVVDPTTGDRYLYLGVTTLSGASENGFDIWAGPSNYIGSVPGEVNARNLYVLNTPNSHSARGVEVTALNNLPLNSNVNWPLEIPLVYIGPEHAGQTFTVSMFDSDNGANPPITFFFDSIAEADWSLTFAQNGVPDPDGGTGRCLPGSCNNQWVNPPYQITIPGNNIEECDFSDPTDTDCFPFYGGWLTARYIGGNADTYVWEIGGPTMAPPTFDPNDGCSAFPIANHEGIRSVTEPASGANPYPDASEFDYPPDPPEYSDFINHSPDEPLLDASTGDVFKVQNGFGEGNFGWLVWNEYVNASTAILENSLTWPGNSQDYETIAPGQTPPGLAHPVYGFIEYGDPSDRDMHIGDWVAASTGSVDSTGVQIVLNGHIDTGRVLRLPIWNNFAGTGPNGRYQISDFGLFKLIGYRLDQSPASPWLLLEFVGFDESCSQNFHPAPTAVSITGPETGSINTQIDFTADIFPLYAATPVTYVWSIDNQIVLTQTNDVSDTFTASWPHTGTYTVSVTAVNHFETPVQASHQITITGESPVDVPPTAVMITGPITGITDTVYTFTATITPISATVPFTYVWEIEGQLPVTQTGGLSDTLVLSWEMDGSYEISVTAVNASGEPVTDTHTIQIGNLLERFTYLPAILKND